MCVRFLSLKPQVRKTVRPASLAAVRPFSTLAWSYSVKSQNQLHHSGKRKWELRTLLNGK